MITDPSHEYLLRQVIQRNAQDMMSGSVPAVVNPDPYNRHHDRHRPWLAWHHPDIPTSIAGA
jgi:hypothetical protein